MERTMSFKTSLSLAVILLGNCIASPQFDHYFENHTLRLDYYHTGTATTENYSIDEVYQEPVWSGSLTQLVDDTNLGKYLFQVFDSETGTLLYSRGFCSIFGEWQTTEQAKSVSRSFSESIRFPWPKSKVKVTLSSRDSLYQFQEKWNVELDPANVNYNRGRFYAQTEITTYMNNGDPQKKVDIVILPDGYTKKEMKKFQEDAKRLLDVFFETEPFKSQKAKFNVRSVNIPSNESDIDNPNKNVYRDNALSCSFNSFHSDRYVLTYDNKTVRKVAACVPYEHIIILANSEKYGGGGIFNLYATCTSDNRWSDYVFVHEFGHSFGGLADEYYTSDTAYDEFYPLQVEPWEPNITVNTDSKTIKWKSLIDKDVPVPTPWDKSTYDLKQSESRLLRKQMEDTNKSQAQIDSLVHANDQWVHDFMRSQTYWGKVGAFEGAGYVPQGIYRPCLDCRMYSRSLTGFCPVCLRAIERVIDFYAE